MPGGGPPAVEQRSADAQHARLMSMVLMVNVLDHLLCAAHISGSEWMVPGFVQEATRFWTSMLENVGGKLARNG